MFVAAIYLPKRSHSQLFFPTRLFVSRYSIKRRAERSSVPASDKAIAPDSQKNTPTSLSERQHKANKPPNRCHATPPRQASAALPSFSAPAIQGKCVFPTLELSSRVCPAGVLPRGERGDGLEVTSTHTPLRHVTSSPPVALALLASSSGPGEQKAKPELLYVCTSRTSGFFFVLPSRLLHMGFKSLLNPFTRNYDYYNEL